LPRTFPPIQAAALIQGITPVKRQSDALGHGVRSPHDTHHIGNPADTGAHHHGHAQWVADRSGQVHARQRSHA
jgi:hypothetical protein